MNDTQPTPNTSPRPPARPNLFAPMATGDKPAPQRISVLASLDTKPAAPPRQKRRPIVLALAAIFGLGMLATLGWYLASESKAPSAADIGRTPTAQTSAPASPPAPPQASAHIQEPHEAIANAPASIENIAEEVTPSPASPTALTHPEPATAASAIAQATAEPTAQAKENTVTPHPKSLLSALATAPEKTTTHDEKAHDTAKSAKPIGKKNLAKNNELITDTDVILLEALVSRNKNLDGSKSAPKEASQ